MLNIFLIEDRTVASIRGVIPSLFGMFGLAPEVRSACIIIGGQSFERAAFKAVFP